MAILTQQEVFELADAFISSRVYTNALRQTFFRFVDAYYVGTLEDHLPGNAQVLSDIAQMNDVERLTSGEVPLQIYLKTADSLFYGAPKQQAVIRRMLAIVSQRVAGSPPIDIANIPEIKEAIIYRDDTVPFIFMSAGLKTAQSVCKLLVPSLEIGQPRLLGNGDSKVYNGTGWLIAKDLLITNHHVINARSEGEAAAGIPDLRLQAAGTTAIFDFDDDAESGVEVAAISLEGWNETLDYAVVKLNQVDRKPIRLAAAKLRDLTEPVAVNIIQHPGGKSKRYGIRNNLVSASTDTDLRYFTDTESGSSGSPVLNDKWEAVALHRGATFTTNVQFQGKSTAYVNVGTHLASILEDVKQRFPALAGTMNI